MDLQVIRKPTVSELVIRVDTLSAQGAPLLILFEDNLRVLQDHFVNDFIASRGLGSHVLLFHGERLRTKDDFWDECVRVMPGVARYFGRNLDALDEVLRDRDHGLAADSSKKTYWVWRNAHGLYASQPEFFRKLFAALVEDSMRVSRGVGLSGIDPIAQRGQPVVLLLTGRWAIMAKEASESDSFLYLTRWWQYKPEPPPEPTHLVVFKIAKDSET